MNRISVIFPDCLKKNILMNKAINFIMLINTINTDPRNIDTKKATTNIS